MEIFEVIVRQYKYLIKFENETTRFKPLNLSIHRIFPNELILERKMFYNYRRRIYNNIMNIQKLGDGLIRKYQIFNELELETLAKYLTDNNILFRI